MTMAHQCIHSSFPTTYLEAPGLRDGSDSLGSWAKGDPKGLTDGQAILWFFF